MPKKSTTDTEDKKKQERPKTGTSTEASKGEGEDDESLDISGIVDEGSEAAERAKKLRESWRQKGGE